MIAVEYVGYASVLGGIALGYGSLRARVSFLQEQLREHKKESNAKILRVEMDANERILRVEKDVAEMGKVMVELKVVVINIDKRTNGMDKKMDKLLEKKD